MFLRTVLFAVFALTGINAVPDLKLTMEPREIELDTTKNVRVKCEVQRADDVKIGILRILRQDRDENFIPIAEISGMAPSMVNALDEPGLTAEGDLSMAGQDVAGYLQVTYETVTTTVYSQYYCDAVILNNDHEMSITIERSPAMDVAKPADILGLVDKLKSMVSENKIEHEGRIIQIEDDHKVVMEQLPGNVSEIRALVWPRGTYGLFKPEHGCPTEDLTEWEEGTRIQRTERSGRNEVSKEHHLPMPVFINDVNRVFAVSQYCMKVNSELGPIWPEGSYCIAKKGPCPEGFINGSITWDDKNDRHGNGNQAIGVLPDGQYDEDTTKIYCCRGDAPAEKEIVLPFTKPFYLYKFGQSCQKVFNMNVKEEYVQFDTQLHQNHDRYGSEMHPAGNLNPLRLLLCYYERDDLHH